MNPEHLALIATFHVLERQVMDLCTQFSRKPPEEMTGFDADHDTELTITIDRLHTEMGDIYQALDYDDGLLAEWQHPG
jgi:hypothetical protein